MHALPITLLLPVEHSIFILGQHLLLCWHLGLPPLDGLHAHAFISQRVVNRGDYFVDSAETLALACFAGSGEAPGDFPGDGGLVIRGRGIEKTRRRT